MKNSLNQNPKPLRIAIIREEFVALAGYALSGFSLFTVKQGDGVSVLQNEDSNLQIEASNLAGNKS